MQFLDDIFFINEHQTVKAELFFARCGQIVFVALVNDFISELAHVADSYLHKSDGGTFVKGKLLMFF